MTQRAQCNLCGEHFPVPQDGDPVLDTEIGRHLFTEHPWAVSMAQDLAELLAYQGVTDEGS
jgi:hypothetical protein